MEVRNIECQHRMQGLEHQLDYGQTAPPGSISVVLLDYALASVNVALGATLLREICSRYPDNHSVDVRWLWPWCAIAAGYTGFRFWRHRRATPFIVILVASLLLAALAWFVHHYSLMLPYEYWIKAGMPGPWVVR